MGSLILYILALITVFALYYFYDENEEKEASKRSESGKPSTPEKSFEQRFSVSSFISSFSSTDDHQDDVSLYDRFSSLEEVTAACRNTGLEECCLIFGIDFTASNEWQGKRSFGQGCLHKVSGSRIYNPYQKVIWTLGQTLVPLVEDGNVFAYGFGDYETRNNAVFSIKKSQDACHSLTELMDCYNQICTSVYYAGPTSYAPIIEKAMEIVSESHRKYHILIVVTDGQLCAEDFRSTEEIIVKASQTPLSIIAVGVGDGPWDLLQNLEEKCVDEKQFPNFRFVDYQKTTYKAKHPDIILALNALIDIPNQYKQIIELGYINKFLDSSSVMSYASILEHSTSSFSASSRKSWLTKLKQKMK